MARFPNRCRLAELRRLPVFDIDRSGWREAAERLDEQGKVVVARHGQPVAVVLSIGEYEALRQALQTTAPARDAALEALRRRFDEHLAPLRAPDAADRLRALMHRPARLGGGAKAGVSR